MKRTRIDARGSVCRDSNRFAPSLAAAKAVFGRGSLRAGLTVLALLLPAIPAMAEEKAGEITEPIRIPTVSVIGSRVDVRDLPGSGQYVTTEDIRDQGYEDINRVLRRVPGVYLREEDGLGLFPNISLRGADTTRSAKVTIMEDGVLTAPAPYSAPAAYYSPTVGRMSGLEVLKGSSQVRYGPHTTGGVINYLSTEIPVEQYSYGRLTYGSNDEILAHSYVGNTIRTNSGDFGWLLEGYFRENDGFKDIDENGSFRDGDDTGLTRYEPMVKLSWEPKSQMPQRFEFKLGYTDMDANISYLGLSEADFAADPFRRYTSTRFDNIETTHTRTYLRHFIEPNEKTDITTTAYYNKFHRNWFKLHDLKDASGERKGLAEALAEGGSHFDVLRGLADGELRIRNNNRDYYVYGIDSVARRRFQTGALDHEVTGGLRYHFDEIRRFQRDELFGVNGTDGSISQTDAGTSGDAGNRRQRTHAIALYVQDEISIGKLTLTPGIRYEHLEQDHVDFSSGTDGDSSLDILAGGIGGTYHVSDGLTVFGGVHRGVSPPGPRASDPERSGLDEETSIGTELGTRLTSGDGSATVESTFFYTHFDDLIVIDNIGGAGSGDSENIGEVVTYGLEFAGDFDLGRKLNWSFSNPYFATFTWTKGECDGDANSDDPESLFAGCDDGNDIPYVPEFQVTVGAGLDFNRFGGDVAVSFTDEMFTTGSNSEDQTRILAGGGSQPDARFGKTDDYTTVDLSGYFELREGLKLVAGVQNVFDEEYVVSRHPAGPRPGRSRFAYGGIQAEF